MRMATARRAASAAPNVLTIDLEEWFHVCGVGGTLAPEHWGALPSRIELTTRWLLDALDATGSRATFFVVGWIAERFPALVQEVMAAGHDIGSHSYMHQLVYAQTPETFRADLRSSVAALHAAGVSNVTAFRAPEWSINDRSQWALDVLASEGFEVDASMAPVRVVGSAKYPRQPHWRTTATGRLYEVPPLVDNWAGQAVPMGWGWGLRMSRPERVLACIEAANRAGMAAVTAEGHRR